MEFLLYYLLPININFWLLIKILRKIKHWQLNTEIKALLPLPNAWLRSNTSPSTASFIWESAALISHRGYTWFFPIPLVRQLASVCHAGCISLFQLLHTFYWFPFAALCPLLGSPLTVIPQSCPCPCVDPPEVSLSMAGSISMQEPLSLHPPPPQHLQPYVSKSITCPWRLLFAFSHVSEIAVLGTWLFMPSFHTSQIPCHQTPATYAQSTGPLCKPCCLL